MGSPMKMPDLASYMQTVIEQLEADKKRSAAYLYVCVEIYRGVLRWGQECRCSVDRSLRQGRLKEYEEWMRREGMRKRKREPKGLSLNTISTYMRNLKAVYHRMVGEKVLCPITRNCLMTCTQKWNHRLNGRWNWNR